MMVEPSGHCPYLGLKQNQAIRFASPTPEHRCYSTGQALEIPLIQPDYQEAFCLSSGHIKCPLYTGSGLPSTPVVAVAPVPIELAAPPSGLRGWFGSLSRRDRAIYMSLLALLALILGIYTVAGANLLRENGIIGDGLGIPPALASSTPASGGVPTAAPTLSDTLTPTATHAVTPSATSTPPAPTDTQAPALPPPPPPTPASSDTPAPLVPVDLTETPTATLTELPTLEPSQAPTVAPTVAPTAAPTSEPTSSAPTEGPTPDSARTITPQPPPQGRQEQQRLTLYFTDATDTLAVSVARLSTVVDKQVALAALGELIAGPRQPGLKRLTPPDVRVLEVRRAGGRLTANFDRRPAWPGDDRGLYAIALTLTELPGVSEVQIQVNGANIGVGGGSGPIVRQAVNPDNPGGQSESFSSGTRFLPLYFLGAEARWVRVTRLVGRTDDVARATLDALLAGPGHYGDRLYSPIPAGAAASGAGLKGDGPRVVVDLTRPFADAFNRQAAVDAIVYSLTELRDQSGARRFRSVEILVEGHKLSDYWGAEFDRQFTRKALNPE